MAEVRRRLSRCSTFQALRTVVSPAGVAPGMAVAAVSLHTLIPPHATCDIDQASVRQNILHPEGIRWISNGSGFMQTGLGPRYFTQGTNFRAAYQNNGERNGSSSLLYKSSTAYYDILEVTGNATQSQIKTAYYKQSFRYHPDRNAGSEVAAHRFGEVTEAYHVLGSVTLRKKYDRGILSLEDVRMARKPSGKGASPTRKDASQRDVSSTASSRAPAKPMFDFDAFYQAHYGEQLERERFLKARRAEIQKLKNEPSQRWPFHKVSEISALFLMLTAAFLLVSFK
ncbi:dnaJ homolog subfamily C member 30, mitochondrial [Pelodytes ibericus]